MARRLDGWRRRHRHHPAGRVRRVHDRVDVLIRDVTPHRFEHAVSVMTQRGVEPPTRSVCAKHLPPPLPSPPSPLPPPRRQPCHEQPSPPPPPPPLPPPPPFSSLPPPSPLSSPPPPPHPPPPPPWRDLVTRSTPTGGRLRAAGVGAAVAAGVARARPDHPATAAGAFDRVLPLVEQRRLPGRGGLGGRRRRLTGRIRSGEPGFHLGGQDPDLLLLLRGQDLLVNQRKM